MLHEEYQHIIVPVDFMHRYCEISCNDCGGTFVNMAHPTLMFYCPQCKMFNCRYMDEIFDGEVRFEQQLKKFPDHILPPLAVERDVSRILQNHYKVSAEDLLKELNIEFNEITLRVIPDLVNNGMLPATLS